MADRASTQACSPAHFDHVSSLAFEARALSSFSNDSLVRRGASVGGTIGGLAGLEGDERAMLGLRGEGMSRNGQIYKAG